MAVDPVCGKTVSEQAIERPVGKIQAGAPVVDPATGCKQFHDGVWHYFCSVRCRTRFVANPDEYLRKARAGGP
jgi:YHS domain-containing protein